MREGVNRRHFLNKGFGLCAAAGMLTASAEALAQVQGVVRRPERFDENVVITERKPFSWPGGKTLAVWMIPNVEVFILSPSGGAQGDVDVLNYSWREYGMRVGLWRLADVMDQAGDCGRPWH